MIFLTWLALKRDLDSKERIEFFWMDEVKIASKLAKRRFIDLEQLRSCLISTENEV